MIITRLTASALPRVVACPASAALPQTEEPSSEYADGGRAIHRYLETRSLDGIEPEHHDACLAIPEWLLAEEGEREAAYAYDVATGAARRVRRNADNRYDLRPFEIGGTADLVRVFDEHVEVTDYKAGHRYVSARDNAQLLLYALCAGQIHDRVTVTIRIVQLSDPADPKIRYSTVDLFDLEDFAARLRRLHTEVAELRQRHQQGERLPVVEGEHCRYCPALPSCPAKVQLMRIATDGALSNEVELAWAGGLTERSAPQAYRQWQMVRQLATRMAAVLHAYAKERPIDLGDGVVFGPHSTTGNEQLDGDVAWHVLREWGGVEAAEEACSFSVSKKGIREALRTRVARGELAATEQRILDAIRERGGASRKETTKIEEHRPAKAKGEEAA